MTRRPSSLRRPKVYRHRVAVRPRAAQARRRQQRRGLALWAALLLSLAASAFAAEGAWQLWKKARSWPIQAVLWEGAKPPGAQEALGLKAGDPLWGFSLSERRGVLLAQCPALRDVDVRRGWDGSVRVKATARLKAALYEDRNGVWAMDDQGVLFPLSPEESISGVVLSGAETQERRRLLLAFYRTLVLSPQAWVKSLRGLQDLGDGGLRLALDSGRQIDWGLLDPAAVPLKAGRLQRVLSDARVTSPGSVQFVDDQRVVVNTLSGSPRR